MIIKPAPVELHGGSVAAASEGAGKGSEFTVRLPWLRDVDGGSPEEEAETESPPPSAGAPARVLLVDDHVAGAKSMGRCCRRWVTRSTSNTMARRHSPPRRPMPLRSRCSTSDCRAWMAANSRASFRAIPEFSKLPLVALTGYGQAEDRERTRAAGFGEHVTKPVRPDDLVPLIEKLVHAG